MVVAGVLPANERVSDCVGFRISGLRFRNLKPGFRVSNFGFRVSDFGFQASGFGFTRGHRGDSSQAAFYPENASPLPSPPQPLTSRTETSKPLQEKLAGFLEVVMADGRPRAKVDGFVPHTMPVNLRIVGEGK